MLQECFTLKLSSHAKCFAKNIILCKHFELSAVFFYFMTLALLMHAKYFGLKVRYIPFLFIQYSNFERELPSGQPERMLMIP
jgi:hypothetical protein